jgi:hypothetical protein
VTAALRRRLEAAERADRGRIYARQVISDEGLMALLELMDRCRTMDDLEVLLGDHPDLAAALDKVWAASGDGGAADPG